MVSLDSVEKNLAFADSLEAKLVLLSDPDKMSAREYGVVGLLRPFPRRWTFYIDPKGVVVHIDKDVDPATAGGDIADTLERLGFPRRPATPPDPPTPLVP